MITDTLLKKIHIWLLYLETVSPGAYVIVKVGDLKVA